MSGVKVTVVLTQREAERLAEHGFRRWGDGVKRAAIEASIEFKVRQAVIREVSR